MNKKILFLIAFAFVASCKTKPPVKVEIPEPIAKENPLPVRPVYRSSYTKYFDLIHTRLNVSFNWKAKELIGQAAIILRPHFYSTDSLVINARGMELKEVSLLSNGKHVNLKYDYDSLLIKMKLDRVYTKDESLTLYISYISRPEKLKRGGSAAINNDKGLYFINADSLDSEKPTQVWTQGETESNSVWFPTIEDPGQKMTQEIYITVDTALTTLSNGLFISSTNNLDGTKTDYWKQSLPAAPYLTMLAAGKYSVIKDKWKNIEVSYYVDPPFEKYAQMTYGNTPEMISYFSDILGVPYVWEKFSQIVVHDYVSGAMENTTAVVHGTNMQQSSRKYIDGNYEHYIAHELFHHWFGDLVTCESWSNIGLNEGFANYSEYLWNEHKYGRDHADRNLQNSLAGYLFSSTAKDPPIFRTQYEGREDVYDAVSYNKCGRVLHMLRKYVGDSAFFASLHLYLTTHMFESVEISDLRIAFEKTTGEDLNWFFDQWFAKGGHPIINIDYDWNDSLHLETVTIKQKQNFETNPLYRLPIDVDLYYNGKTERRKIIIDQAEQKFIFNLPVKPDLVNVDAEKMLLVMKTDSKSNAELIFQFDHAPLYLDRLEAIFKIGGSYKVYTPEASLVHRALKDKYDGIRLIALNNIGELAMNDTTFKKEEIKFLALHDSSSDVREKALTCIGKYFSYSEFSQAIASALNDSSYKVVSRAFKIISDKDAAKAKDIALTMEKDSSDVLLSRLSEYYSTSKENKIDFYKRALRYNESFSRYTVVKNFTTYLVNNTDTEIILEGSNVLADRAKKTTSTRMKTAISNSLKEIESSVEKRISQSETELATISDSSSKIEKEASVTGMKSLQNKLHDKINAIEK